MEKQMKFVKKVKFSKKEIILWMVAMIALYLSYHLSDAHIISLFAFILGVSALLFLAKGEPIGQVLVIVFSTLYAIISYKYRYYGEIFTYVGMTVPSALVTAIIWYKHPHSHKETVVKIAKLTPTKRLLIWILTPMVTLVFYAVLRYFQTPSLLVGTLSITTSFIASMLMFFRSRIYGYFYALNDIVLIIL